MEIRGCTEGEFWGRFFEVGKICLLRVLVIGNEAPLVVDFAFDDEVGILEFLDAAVEGSAGDVEFGVGADFLASLYWRGIFWIKGLRPWLLFVCFGFSTGFLESGGVS